MKYDEIPLEWENPTAIENVLFNSRDFISDYKDYDSVDFKVKFDGLACAAQHQALQTNSASSFMQARTDYGLFKSNIPGLSAEDLRT